MKLIKKDWMYDANRVLYIVLGIVILVSIVSLSIFKLNIVNSQVIFEIYNEFLMIGIILFGIYPCFAFKAVCPQIGTDKLYLSTANLPYSRKEIFFKGLKKWFVFLPVYIIIGSLVAAILNVNREGFISNYITSIIELLNVLFLSVIILINLISGTIIYLSKKVNGVMVIMSLIIGNILLILLLASVVAIIGNPISIGIISFGVITYLIVLVAIFYMSWRDIENIWQ